MDCSVIICTYNRSESLARTLRSLKEMGTHADFPWELIVVDNNSSDDTREVVENFASSSAVSVEYVFEEKQGLCHARNAGVRKARGKYLAFTDDDVTVDPCWLHEVKRAFDESDSLGVAGRILPVWTCEKPSWIELDGPHALMAVLVRYDLGDAPVACGLRTPPLGANMAFRRDVFERFGGFRPDLDRVGTGLLGGGDTEYCRRILRAGGGITYAPRAIVFHPVEEHRKQKAYIRSWYFNYGRSLIRVNGIPPSAVCWWGVPRYLLRILAQNFVSSIASFGARQRFYYHLSAVQTAGEIKESFLMSRIAKRHRRA